MKVVLQQRTSVGAISIGRSSDGKFYVLWKGQPPGEANTLADAMALAADDLPERAPDGTDFRKLSISWRPKDWYVAE
jgi:hypothetical protein